MAQIPKHDRPLPPKEALQRVDNIYDSPTRKLAWPTSEIYEDMLADARTLGVPEPYYEVFSGFRSDAQQQSIYSRHATQDSSVIARPGRSAHRTGHAMDIYMGHKPGFRIDDSSGENVNHIRKSSAYRTFATILAPRYRLWELPSEPWHWECDEDCRALFLMDKYGIDGELARQIVNYEIEVPNGDMTALLDSQGFTSTMATSGLSRGSKIGLTILGLTAFAGATYMVLDRKNLI